MSSQSPALAHDFVVSDAAAKSRATGIPWYCYVVALGAACSPIGSIWDISWHLSIGRDTFWTPAHMMVYLGGSVPGLICGWLVLKTTFWPDAGDQAATVKLWGFRGPIGAWVVIWGAFMMLLSGPFDNWWHNAYGLDVQIISPPHTVLALGIYAIGIGTLLFVVSWQNRASGTNYLPANLLVLFACGVLLTELSIFTTEFSYPNSQHGAGFYDVSCRTFPIYLIIAARISRIKWGATWASVVYFVIRTGMVWILPLFHSVPKLAPIYNPITHMAPPPFPLLLIVPALGIDVLMQARDPKGGFWADTRLAVLLGGAFFVLLVAVQWPFSEFLVLSPGSRNAFFAGDRMWGYFDEIGDWCTRFWDLDRTLGLKSALTAALLGGLAARIALWFSNWLAGVKR